MSLISKTRDSWYMIKMAVQPRFAYSPWLIWGLGAAFFFTEYYARVAPSVMAMDLMAEFKVNAFALGSLSAFFYYAYVSMQLPVGAMMDRFGPQRLLTINALFCALGAFTFAYAPNIFIASIGRLFMGFGAAFAFVGSLKLASIWFPSSRFGLMAGLTQAIGMLGAATGEGPMAIVVSVLGWQDTMIWIGIIFIILALAIGLIVKDGPLEYSRNQTEMRRSIGLFTSVKRVLSNPQSWYSAVFVGLLYATTASFGELWGVSFLRAAYHVDVKQAAAAVGMIFIGWGIGGPLAGWVSDLMGRRKPLMFISALVDLIIILFVIYVHMPFFLIYILLFIYGMFNMGVSITYALAAEINPRSISGTSMAFANMASVIIGAFFQPLIGFFLDFHSSHRFQPHKLHHTYNLIAFQKALVILPICLAVSLLVIRLMKETYCKNITDST